MRSYLAVILLMVLTSPEAVEMKVKLSPCPTSPNCVSSQASSESSHYIAPFKIKTSSDKAWAAIKNVLKSQSRTVISKETIDVIDAEVISLIFRFVDDVQILLDKEAGLIHIRSASRTGHSDLGVNRKRVEKIRVHLQQVGVIE
jgi:uncharacterized protein (DUF1499 family)